VVDGHVELDFDDLAGAEGAEVLVGQGMGVKPDFDAVKGDSLV
jgi:hypothetical protein